MDSDINLKDMLQALLQGPASETVAMVKNETASNDLKLLRSEEFADAEIICNGDVRKVHRAILASRSHWFKRVFSDNVMDLDGVYRIYIDETAWKVDLILYYFYVGHIDIADKALTADYNEMALSVNLLELGNSFEEIKLQRQGYELLKTNLIRLHACLRNVSTTAEDNKARINETSDVLSPFCQAVYVAFEDYGGVWLAQSVLAFFAFKERTYLNECKQFWSLTEEVPEFGKKVLEAAMSSGSSE